MRLFHSEIETREPSAIRRFIRRLRRSATLERWTSSRGSTTFPAIAVPATTFAQEQSRPASNAPPVPRRDAPESNRSEWLDAMSAALPHYEILLELDSGGQGVVYEALHVPANRRVAIKILRDGPIASPQQIARFNREIEMVARLRHPNIVTLHETGTALGRPYFVMEFIDGWPVDEHAVVDRPSVRRVVEWFERVCLAVSHAHQRGVIHRDLKASNILIDETGEPRVLDFGLAKDLRTNDDHTDAGQVLGTLPYLAPEQVTQGGAEADVRTDVYAIGVALYKTLTGRFPYNVSGSTKETIDAITSTPPMRLRRALVEEIRPEFRRLQGINEDLECILQKSLAKDKSRRYSSAAAFAEDLRSYLDGRAVAARAGHNWYQFRKTVRRYRTPLGIAAAFGVILGATLAGMTASWQRELETGRISTAALQAAGFVRAGQAAREAGNRDAAIQSFRSAIEAAHVVGGSDPQLFRQVFTGHYALAELLMAGGDVAGAESNLRAAEQIVAELESSLPEDPEILRLRGFGLQLAGKLASRQGDWAACVNGMSEAEPFLRDFGASAAVAEAAQFDVAVLLFVKAHCQRKLGDDGAALATYGESHELLADLAHSGPLPVKYAFELARVEGEMAFLELRRKTIEGDAKAARWLAAAYDRLIALQGMPEAGARKPEIDQLLEHVRSNTSLATRRLQATASGTGH